MNGQPALTAQEQKDLQSVKDQAAQQSTKDAEQEADVAYLKGLAARRLALKHTVAITEAENNAASRRDQSGAEERPPKTHKHFNSLDVNTKPDAEMDPTSEVSLPWQPGALIGTLLQVEAKGVEAMNSTAAGY